MASFSVLSASVDKTNDEIMMKFGGEDCFKICLACMTGCWDPEFEPSVEEIVDYR